jgi:hypothetical protein
MRHGSIFADHAQQLRAQGFAVLPTHGKVPLIAGWHKWRNLPSAQTVERFARQFPDANIAMLPELSSLFIADVDLAAQVPETEDLIGRTPLHVATGRGRHLYYRYVCIATKSGCYRAQGRSESWQQYRDRASEHSSKWGDIQA